MGAIFTNIAEIFANSGWAQIFFAEGGWKYAVMIGVACVLLYLAIVHQFEPLLLLPIGFGMLMTNLPLDGIFHMDIFINETQHINWELLGTSGGMADYIYLGVKLGIYPPLIFLGIGTMTDFEPLIARPSSLLLGAAAQLGIFFTFVGAKILGFTNQEAGAIGIIGGADGPTAIYVTTKLAPHLLGSIAVAAYCYMALVPVIQPPIMKALTTEKERQIVMTAPRRVSKTEKILFPIIVTIIVALTLPDAAILVGCLMMGNLMKESGVVERITKTAGNELMNIITIFLGFSVGCTTNAATFLNIQTVEIIVLGIVAFGVGTAGGADTEGDDAQNDDLNGLDVQEGGGVGGAADGEAEEDRDDVHQLIAGGLGDTLNNAGLLHQVAHHQAADQNGGVRQGQGNDDGDDDGEQDLLGLGDTAGGRHDDLTLFFSGQGLHDGRLDDRHQRHVAVRGNRDGAQQVRGQLGGDVDGGGAVRAADDADSAGLLVRKAQDLSADEGEEDAQLCGSAQQQAGRACNQRLKVGHGTDAKENQRGIDTQLDT